MNIVRRLPEKPKAYQADRLPIFFTNHVLQINNNNTKKNKENEVNKNTRKLRKINLYLTEIEISELH